METGIKNQLLEEVTLQNCSRHCVCINLCSSTGSRDFKTYMALNQGHEGKSLDSFHFSPQQHHNLAKALSFLA